VTGTHRQDISCSNFSFTAVSLAAGEKQTRRHRSFNLAQIGEGSRVTEQPAHGNDLALVMKGMRQDMVKDERRRADEDVPIGEMKLRIGIELLVGQGRQIGVGRPADFFLQKPHIGEHRAVLNGPVDIPQPLERVYPKPFAVAYVNRLVTQAWGSRSRIPPSRNRWRHGGEVIQNQIEAGVCPAMKCAKYRRG